MKKSLKKLRKCRLKLRAKVYEQFLNFEHFATISGIHGATISRIFHRKREPTQNQKLVLETLLDTPIKELLQ